MCVTSWFIGTLDPVVEGSLAADVGTAVVVLEAVVGCEMVGCKESWPADLVEVKGFSVVGDLGLLGPADSFVRIFLRKPSVGIRTLM